MHSGQRVRGRLSSPARVRRRRSSSSSASLSVVFLPYQSCPVLASKKERAMESMLDKSSAESYFGWKASFTLMTSVIKNGVKELRLARNWTQEQLAEAVGVSRQSINAIERNRYVPGLELALILGRVFSCP